MLLRELLAKDRTKLETMLRSMKSFSNMDLEIALELIDDRLAKGVGSDYKFVVAADGDAVLGYACYGRIPLTEDSFDLYWIAVSPDQQGKKIGVALMKQVEQDVLNMGGARIYADTSSTEEYARARKFYLAAGFAETARLPHFYRKNDAKVIYSLEL